MAGTMAREKIMDELDYIKKSVIEIKEDLSEMKHRIANVDAVLLDGDIEALDEADKEFSNRKTKRL